MTVMDIDSLIDAMTTEQLVYLYTRMQDAIAWKNFLDGQREIQQRMEERECR